MLVDWIGKGLTKGYGDGSFMPGGAITRAEFMALVNR
ncbi:S-layer homology domain-containing protein [Sporosarcina obsidiansis]